MCVFLSHSQSHISSTQQPTDVRTLHEYKKKVINYDSRGGISIETRKGEITTSHLLIQNADETNSGKYSCSPSNAIVASIRVHVLNGKWFTIIVICRPHQVERNKGI